MRSTIDLIIKLLILMMIVGLELMIFGSNNQNEIMTTIGMAMLAVGMVIYIPMILMEERKDRSDE